MARKERVFTVQRVGAHATLDGVIVDLDTAISQEQIYTVPVLCDVFERQPGWRVSASVIRSRLVKSTMLVVSMVVYLLRLGCCLATTNPPDTLPTFKSSKHQIQS
jgi:hypothetical protein